MRAIAEAAVGMCLVFGAGAACCPADIVVDQGARTVTIADEQRALVLHVICDGRCVIDQVTVRGREVAGGGGAYSGVAVGQARQTTRERQSPTIAVSGNTVTIDGLSLHAGSIAAEERWIFTAETDRIRWRIERAYSSGGDMDDTAMPAWDFASLSTWTGALLGQGGVAWCKLLDKPNATYGVHTGAATFWSREHNDCLRITAAPADRAHVATRFTRQPDGRLASICSITTSELATRHELRRFLADRQDVWAPTPVSTGTVAVEYTLQACPYDREFDRGRFSYFDGAAIREIANTIARIGAIDKHVHGSNGWYSGYAVLHEHWLAQLGLLIDDPAYTRAYADTLDYQRDHAIGPDGRVKSRWAYGPWDAAPGSYDADGFYEAQWGVLLDSQTGWLVNVAEQFDFTGDLAWLRQHKAAAERVLDYLRRRDTNGNGLVEMLTDAHTAKRGSDWIDVVWAAYENALVNAELYYGLTLWTDLERLLGDADRARQYETWAAHLKESFNRPAREGGFWNPEGPWYVYWRDKDGSVHGDNLVTPVNFMVIAYGICDDPARRAAILDRIEAEMQKEKLFFWPLCLTSFAQEELGDMNWPFPKYENGDIFLGWGELGVRAYAPYKPAIAVRCIKNVLDQYSRDGLAFQRYLRATQQGAGDDILANNCSPLIGLYRDIYGIQPKYNRLYIEPHLTPELDGTELKYRLRDQLYIVGLRTGAYSVSVEDFRVKARQPFGVAAEDDAVRYFPGQATAPELEITRSARAALSVQIESWQEQDRRWTVDGPAAGGGLQHRVCGLTPKAVYHWTADDHAGGDVESDATGSVRFASPPSQGPLRLHVAASGSR